jgi:MscS family membrane protein
MRVGNVQAWQWIALLLLLALGILASQTLTRAVYAAVHLFGRRTEPEFRKRLLESVRLPVRLATTLAVVTLGSLWLHLSVPARRNLGHVGIGLLLALIAYALMKLVDLAVSRTLERLQAQGRRSGVSTLVLLRRCLKGVIVAVAGLALLQNLGFNVTGLLTGFGIAGAAIALAAQKTLENLFAGLVLAADEPVRIGDLCRFGNQQGIVEDIGLRSTRIRTFDRSVIYVPNAEMSTIQIENLAVRDRMRLLTTLSLRYETTQEQLTAVLGGIRELLAKDERVAPEDLRVRFVAFGPYSLDVEVMAYVLTTDFATFLEIREDLYLRIMRIVRESGTGFAFPSQTLYVAPDPGRGAART